MKNQTLSQKTSTLFYAIIILFVFPSMATPQSQASPSTIQVFTDEGGMPRCFAFSDSRQDFFLDWESQKDDHYRRDIFAIKISSMESGQVPGTVEEQIFEGKRNCSEWPYLTRNAIRGTKIPFLREGSLSPEFRAMNLPEWSLQALQQVELGAGEYLADRDPQNYLKDHPMDEFTIEINQELSKKYGIGFAASIYKEWVLSQPTNGEFEETLKQSLDSAKSKSTDQVKINLVGSRGPIHVALMRGLMQAPENDKVEPMMEVLRSYGVPTHYLHMKPLTTTWSNAQLAANHMKEILLQGHDLIVVGASKGSGELLSALSQLDEFLKESQTNPDRGRVLAMINFSGLVRSGSFLINWGTQVPYRYFVFPKMRERANYLEIDHSELEETLQSISTLNMESFLNETYPQLPSSVVYFSLLGVLPYDGLSPQRANCKPPTQSAWGIFVDAIRELRQAYPEKRTGPKPPPLPTRVGCSDIRYLQDHVARTLVPEHGANDGYVEYPGTSIHPQEGLHVYETIVDASHILLDGSYHGFDLSQRENLEAFTPVLFHSVSKFVKRHWGDEL